MGEWRKTNIEEIASVNMGQSPDSNFVNEVEFGMPFLQGNAEFGTRTPEGIFWCTRPRKTAQKSDILVSVRAPVGAVNIADKEYCIGRGLAAVNFWGINKEFSSYAFSNVVPQLHIKSQGTTFLAVSKGDIDKAIISYPISDAEQSKIAEILSTVDEAIDKTRELIEKFKNIKAGIMQDLLDSGDEVPLSQLCQITSGSTPATSDLSYWDGYNVWITPNDLSGITTPFVSTSARKLTDSGVKKATRVLLPPNSVIISNRAPVGYCAIVTVPFTFNQGCKGLVCNPDTDPLYLYYYLSKSKSQLERVSSGTTFLELPKKELNRFLIRIPKTINEQQAISEQILAADERIQTERDYLAKLQDIKLGLMQDLLTNTVSVDALL